MWLKVLERLQKLARLRRLDAKAFKKAADELRWPPAKLEREILSAANLEGLEASLAWDIVQEVGGAGLQALATEAATVTAGTAGGLLGVLGAIGEWLGFSAGSAAAVAAGTVAVTVVAGVLVTGAAMVAGSLSGDRPVQIGVKGDKQERTARGDMPERPGERTDETKDGKGQTGRGQYGQMPASFTVSHKRELIWPTTLNLVKQEGDTGNYRGADFQGNGCESTMQFRSGSEVYIFIKCAHGYTGSYYGRRQGSVVEGEYHPGPGFGPTDYFKAFW